MKQKPDDLDDETLIAALTALLARAKAPGTDWVDAYNNRAEGDAMTTTEAAVVAGTSAETVRRHCIEVAAAGKSLGICVDGIWIVSCGRLLADIAELPFVGLLAVTQDDDARRRGEARSERAEQN